MVDLWIIIEEEKRRKEKIDNGRTQIPLELPLYPPYYEPKKEQEPKRGPIIISPDDDDDERSDGVIIIDLSSIYKNHRNPNNIYRL